MKIIDSSVIDGRSHKWDDIGEAVHDLAYHYWRLIKTIICDVCGRDLWV